MPDIFLHERSDFYALVETVEPLRMITPFIMHKCGP
jgi:hypothetical protein